MSKDKKTKTFKQQMNEDAPANAVGGGNVAALGVGEQGEPPAKARLTKMWRRYLEGKY